jgi:pimeloyl-ACP methyl ester carboxylesterase/DNA-binding CsgD family transcriptional regulator
MGEVDCEISSAAFLEPELLAELIGAIYDAAADPANWPEVLQSIDNLLKGFDPGRHDTSEIEVQGLSSGEQGKLGLGMAGPVHWTPAERRLWKILTPHLIRADAIRQEISILETERDALDIMFDRLPLGSAMVDERGNLIYANREFLDQLNWNGLLRLADGVLEFRSQTEPGASLKALVKEALDAENGQPVFSKIGKDATGNSVSLFISRGPSRASNHSSNQSPNHSQNHDTDDGPQYGQTRLLICIAQRSRRELSVDGLISYYALTPAEARLTQKLVSGLTLDTYATEQGISLSTVKTQLKAVFSKTGVNRQAELIAALYTSPLWFLDEKSGADMASPRRNSDLVGQDSSAGRLLLPDGRALCWSDNGDPNGKPLILMHGIGSTRNFRHPDDLPLLESGIRLVIPERPGIGDSSPQPDREIADWVADISALANHLGVKQFAVLGYSGGTPYALAVAIAMSDRVTHVALVAAIPELSAAKDLARYAATFNLSTLSVRLPLLTARALPSLFLPLMRVIVRSIKKSPNHYLEQSLAMGTDSDRAAFANPRLRQIYLETIKAGTRCGEEELVREYLLLVRDWGIDFTGVRAPIRMWHGSSDKLVSLDGAKNLARTLGDPMINVIDHAGHYILFSHWHTLCNSISAFLDE